MFHQLGWPEKERKPANLRVRPKLEMLEDRTVLTTLGGGTPAQITYSASILSGRMVSVTGTVIDQRPENCVVTFGGILNHTVTPNPDGSFSFVAEASSRGFITSQVLDDENLVTVALAQYIEGTYSEIINVEVIEGEDPGMATVNGAVTGDVVEGMPVYFEGAGTGSTFLMANASFSWSTLEIKPGDLRIIFDNIWGNRTDVNILIRNRPPVVKKLAFRPTVLGGHYEFHGKVLDEEVNSCVVRFSGIPALEGKTAQVNAEGKYSIIVPIGANDVGMVTVIARDRHGADSEPREIFFSPL
jgi:hypothetical protein